MEATAATDEVTEPVDVEGTAVAVVVPSELVAEVPLVLLRPVGERCCWFRFR